MASINAVGMGIRAGVKLKSGTTYLKRISKVVEPGGVYRIFFPKVKVTMEDGTVVDDILSAVARGRDLDYKALSQGFITYKPEWYDINEDTGEVTDKVGLDKAARIARVIFEANYEADKARIEDEARVLAQANGGQMDQTSYSRKMTELDEKYHGREKSDSVDAIAPKIYPIVRGLTAKIVIECLVVPMDKSSNVPKWDKAEYCYKEFSRKVLLQLISILDNPDFNDPNKNYLEVLYNYGAAGQTAQQAGQNATYQGINGALSLETAFADSWNTIGKTKVEGIAGGEKDVDKAAAIILQHSGYVAGKFTPEDLKSNMNKYMSKNAIILTHINMNDPSTLKGAQDLIDSGYVDSLSMIKEKLTEVVAKNSSDASSTVSVATPAPTPVVTTPAPTPVVSQPVAQTTPTEVPFEQAPAMDNQLTQQAAQAALNMINQAQPLQEGAGAVRTAVNGDIADDEEELGDLEL